MHTITTTGLIWQALNLLTWVIILDVIFTWVVYLGKMSSYHPIPKTLHSITSPLLDPIRKVLPAYRTGGLDLSPMILIMLLRVLQGVIGG